MSSNSGAGNLIASFNQNNLRITLTMTIASFDVLLEQAINLIYAQGMHYKVTADAIKNDDSIEFGKFRESREFEEVEELMPEIFDPLNMFGFNEAEYKETRAKLIIDKNKDFSKARIARKDAAEKTYASLLAICDSETSNNIKMQNDFKEVDKIKSPTGLLNIIRILVHRQGKPDVEMRIIGLTNARSMFQDYRRPPRGEMRDAYSYSKSIRGKHRAAVSAGYDPCVSFTEMIGDVKDAVNGKITMEELIALAKARSEGNLARLMILNCSSRPLQENLLSQWTGGQKNIYPDNVFDAIKLLKMQDSFTGRKKKIEDREEDKDIKGASANTCNRTSFTNSIYLLTQGNDKADFKNDTILLDTCSNISIVKNKDLIDGLREDAEGMEIRSNGGGIMKCLEYGYFKDCNNLKVWYNDKAIGNILSFSQVMKIAKIKMVSNGFIVLWPNGTSNKFTTRGTDIYHYIHRDDPKRAELNAMHSVAGNEQSFSKRDCGRARKVIDLEAMLAYPSRRSLRSALENKVINNCTITSSDVVTAQKIWGPNPEAMAGTTTRRPSTEVALPSNNNNVWPISIHIKYKAICLCADILTINGIKFLTTVVPTVKHSTATVLNKADKVSV